MSNDRKTLQVRLPVHFYNAIKKDAERRCMTLSSYIRNFIIEFIYLNSAE